MSNGLTLRKQLDIKAYDSKIAKKNIFEILKTHAFRLQGKYYSSFLMATPFDISKSINKSRFLMKET